MQIHTYSLGHKISCCPRKWYFGGDFVSSTMRRRTDKWSFVDVDIPKTRDMKVLKEENEPKHKDSEQVGYWMQ